jgi:hypothetical protein
MHGEALLDTGEATGKASQRDTFLQLLEQYERPRRALRPSNPPPEFSQILVSSAYIKLANVGPMIMSAGLFLERAKAATMGRRDIGGPAVFAAVWWLNEVASVGRLARSAPSSCR